MQTKVYGSLADALVFEPLRYLCLGAVTWCACEVARIDHGSVFGVEQQVSIAFDAMKDFHGRFGLEARARQQGTSRDNLVVGTRRIQVDHIIGEDECEPRPDNSCIAVGSQIGTNRLDAGVEIGSCGQYQRTSIQSAVGYVDGIQGGGHAIAHGARRYKRLRAIVDSINDGNDGQSELERKGKIPLIMSGNGHDGAGPVRHQDVIGNPNRHLLPVDRIDGVTAREHTRLLALGGQTINFRSPSRLAPVFGNGVPLFFVRQLIDERMLGSQHHEGGSPQGVGACGEHGDRIAGFGGKHDFGSFGTADPVFLHLDDVVGPLLQLAEIVEQSLREVGDLKEPLLQIPRLGRCAAAFALTTHHLFVGQHGVTSGTIIDCCFLLVSQAVLVQLNEQPLRPLVIIGQARGDFAIPIELDAPGTKLLFRSSDVLLGEGPRMRLVLNGCVLGGKAESIPAHRVQDL